MRHALNASRKKGETYEMLGASTEDNQTIRTENLPSVVLSIVPIVTLIFLVVVFSNTANFVLIALTAAILLAALLFRKQLPDQ